MYLASTLIIASMFGMFRLANISGDETSTSNPATGYRPVFDHRHFPE